MTKKKKADLEANAGKRKNTSLRLDSKKLKALKIRAIEDDTSVQQILEVLIDDYLSKFGKQ